MLPLELLALRVGIAVPILYFGTLFVAWLHDPGFSFVRQYASELGADGAPHPQVLNRGLYLVSAASLIAAFGYWRGLRRLGAGAIATRWTSCIVVLFGVAMGFAGFYPHPDWRHSGFGTGFFLLGGPAMLAASLWRRSEARALRRYLISTNLVMLVMVLVLLGAGRTAMAGLCQLLYTLAAIPWIGVGAHALTRYRSHASPIPRAALPHGTLHPSGDA